MDGFTSKVLLHTTTPLQDMHEAKDMRKELWQTKKRQSTTPTKSFSPSLGRSLQRKPSCGSTLIESVESNRKLVALQPPLVQPKLIIGQSKDKYEQAADRLAERAMSMPQRRVQRACPSCDEDKTVQTAPLTTQITPFVQRQLEPEDEEEVGKVQTKHQNDMVQRQVETEDEESPSLQSKCDQCPKKHPLQRSSRIASHPIVPAIVHEVLRSPGQPLDEATRAFMEPRLGHDFRHVRMHQDRRAEDSARAVNARAYTVGSDIVFGAGQYMQGSSKGHQMIAHELAHVVQQSLIPATSVKFISQPGDPAEIEAVKAADAVVSGNAKGFDLYARPIAQLMRDEANLTPELGTAKTTSPVAKLSPRAEMLKELTDETILFNNAQVIIDWVIKKAQAKSAKGGTTDNGPLYLFNAAELLKEKGVVKRLKPVPKTEDDLSPTLALMRHYEAIRPPSYTSMEANKPEYLLPVDPKTKQPDLSIFSAAKKSIIQFTQKFRKRQERPSPLNPVVETSVLPLEMSAGSVSERKPEKQAEDDLAKLNQELDALDMSGANDDATLKKREDLKKKIESAKERLRIASGYHTFASEVTNLLERLRMVNTSWKAGTYVGHSWGEFSVDIFLSANLIEVKDADEFSGQYWDRKIVRKFFDDLNDAAEKDDPKTGKFAWRAIYNDKPLAKEINKKFGAGRVIHVVNHGPAPDHKLHIHLDLRPVKIHASDKSGYRMKAGRVELL